VKKDLRVYPPQEFLEKLVRDDLKPPLVFTGMVKKGEDNLNQVLFATGTNCANWRAVSLEMVESIEVLEIVPCKDHTHPRVKIYFKKPKSKDAMLFASLAAAMVRAARDAMIKMLDQIQPGGAIVRSASGDCAQCFRDCRVQSPEDFLACLDRCARLCPPIVEPQFAEANV
jgi:hypothetical protein